MESIQAFADREYRVDVITSSALELKYKPNHLKIRVITYPDNKGLFDYLFISFFKKVYLYQKHNSYDIVIGMSQKGLIAATLLMFRKPVIYFNDELWTGYEGRKWYKKIYNRVWKCIEQFCNRRVTFSVNQDNLRADLLAKINKIPRESIILLPNSFSGKASRKESSYLQKKFHIPEKSNTLLSIGAIPVNSGYLELAEEAKKWPEEFRLVFHMRHPVSPQKYSYAYRTLESADNKHVYASVSPVSYEILVDIVASSKIGLALYGNRNSRDLNALFIGYSSGKVNLYLKLGIPVIAQDFPGFKWIEESGAGICVSEYTEVFGAAKDIMANYNFYSENALKTFKERLSFDCSFEIIENKVRRISTNKNLKRRVK